MVKQQRNTLGIAVICERCPHQVNGKAVTSQEWADTNGDVYFSASSGESPNALIYFIDQHAESEM